MTEEEILKLHHRASQGEKLTPAEFSILQNWYEENDRSEDLSLNNLPNESGMADFNNQLTQILGQVSRSASKVKQLARQNAALKQENEVLHRAVENQLIEKVA